MNNRIAIVLNSSWNLYNFRLNLARAIKDAGYEVILIAPQDSYSKKLEEEFSYYEIAMDSKGTNPFVDIKLLYSFFMLYKKIEPAVILHYTIKPNIYGTLAARILKISTINNIAGLGNLFVNQNILTTLAQLMYKYSQQKATKVFFQNKDDYNLFISTKLIDKMKCDILPGSGVDLIKFKPSKHVKEGEKFKFLLIARILWDKGIAEYVEAARLIKSRYENIEFQLLGSLTINNPTAIPKDRVYKWVEDGLINYLGETDNVEEFIKESDCVVLPSFYREGVPRVLLESASMAKPIITTNHIGCKEAVDNNISGYLCNLKDSKDLANKMEKMIFLTEVERREMGKKGREKMVREFDEKIVIKKYLEAIEKLVVHH